MPGASKVRKSSARVSKSGPKEAQREPKGSQRAPEGNQKGVNTSQNVAKINNSCSQIKPWSVRISNFFYVELFHQNGKHGRGTLVGLTWVKGTSAEKAKRSPKWPAHL